MSTRLPTARDPSRNCCNEPADLLSFVAVLLGASDTRVVDAARRMDAAAVRALVDQKAEVNAPQIDGTTACTGPFEATMCKLPSC